MKTKLKKVLLSIFSLIAVALFANTGSPSFFGESAANETAAPRPELSFGYHTLSTQEAPGSGGGTSGPGINASPIDTYEFALLAIAVMIMVYFAWKYRSRLAKA